MRFFFSVAESRGQRDADVSADGERGGNHGAHESPDDEQQGC